AQAGGGDDLREEWRVPALAEVQEEGDQEEPPEGGGWARDVADQDPPRQPVEDTTVGGRPSTSRRHRCEAIALRMPAPDGRGRARTDGGTRAACPPTRRQHRRHRRARGRRRRLLRVPVRASSAAPRERPY